MNQRQPIANSKPIKRLQIVMGAIAGILAIANIVVSASLSSTGEKLRGLEESTRELKQQNQLLEQKVVTARSLTKISGKAESLGFTTTPQIVTISIDEAIAQVF